MKATPGVVSGYWFAPVEGRGLSLVLLENDEAARSATAMISNTPSPDFVSFESIEVREVVRSNAVRPGQETFLELGRLAGLGTFSLPKRARRGLVHTHHGAYLLV